MMETSSLTIGQAQKIFPRNKSSPSTECQDGGRPFSVGCFPGLRSTPDQTLKIRNLSLHGGMEIRNLTSIRNARYP